MKPWFIRWKQYPVSVLLHIMGWGATSGALVASEFWPAGVAMLAIFVVYELASGVRHAINDKHMDTLGLDCVDAVVGFVPAYIAVSILTG